MKHELEEHRQVHAEHHGPAILVSARQLGGKRTTSGAEIGENDDRRTPHQQIHLFGQSLRILSLVAHRHQNVLIEVRNPPDRIHQSFGQLPMTEQNASHQFHVAHSPARSTRAPDSWRPATSD